MFLLQWIDERWPLSSLFRLMLDEEIPGGARFAYADGSAILILFALQVVTGIMQLFFYVPALDHAYDSLGYLRTEVPFGWLMHGFHYWGAQLMVIAVVLHMARVYIWGAYKKPRELLWLAGVLLLLTTMALSFTGALLPWDQEGYWAGEVGTSIAGTVPVAGDFVKRLLRGGDQMGQLTLSRFFIAHSAIFPTLLIALFGIHYIAFRRFGSIGPWKEAERRHAGPFWPDQALKDVLVGTAVFFLLIALSVFAPPEFTGPADILDTSYVPKPEWNFLFLYQALKYFHGPLEPLGTIGVPTVFIALLFLAPFIDRNPERNPLRRPVAMLCGLIYLGALAVLTLIGYYSPGLAQMPAQPLHAEAEQAAAAKGQKEAGAGAPRIFTTAGCTGCHRVGGVGGAAGPRLSRGALASKGRAWIVEQVRNPKAHNPNTIMPSFASLSGRQINEIVAYLAGAGTEEDPGRQIAPRHPAAPPAAAGRRTSAQARGAAPGKAAAVIGSASRGAALFRSYCASCHGPKGAAPVPNPGSRDGKVPQLNPIDRAFFNTGPKVFAENIDRFIQHGSVPAGKRPGLSMPAFGDTNSLTQPEIANIEAYILKLNGVDRAQPLNPGMRPRNLFLAVVAVYVLFFLVQAGIRVRRNMA